MRQILKRSVSGIKHLEFGDAMPSNFASIPFRRLNRWKNREATALTINSSGPTTA